MNQELIKQLTYYDPKTGLMMWKKRPLSMFKRESNGRGWNTLNAGKVLASVDGKGYIFCSIMYKQHRVHRLIWLYVHGEWPSIIDHINGSRTDNRLVNLREVTSQQNHMNQRISSKNTSGVTGVYFMKAKNIWCAQMKFNGKTYHLGSSKDKSEVVAIRKAEEKRLGFSERHGESHAY